MYNKYGEQHHNYKGECDDGYGYLTILHNGKRQFVHRVVIATALGIQELPEDLHVHHIDSNKHNNELDNLALTTSKGHKRIHVIQDSSLEESVPELSLSDLGELLDYNAYTGELTWKICKLHNGKLVKGIATTKSSNGYLYVHLRGEVYAAHRLIWFGYTGGWPVHNVYHINGIKTDNRWCNLKIASPKST